MLRKALLAGAAALPMLLAGCALPHLGASPEQPYVYDPKISHARNVALLFHLFHSGELDRSIPIETKPYEGLSSPDPLVTTAAWTGNLYSAAGSSLPGTSSLGKAAAVSAGLGLALSLITPDRNEGMHHILGFVPVRIAPTSDEARTWIVDTVTEAFEKAARDLYPNAEIEVINDDSFVLNQYARRVVIRKKTYGCNDNSDCYARIAADQPEFAMEHAGDLTPHERFWVFGDLDTQLTIRDKAGTEGSVDWKLVAMRTSVYLPEYTYIDVQKHAGSGTPKCIVEKGRVNYYVLPSVQPTKPQAETAADEKKK